MKKTVLLLLILVISSFSYSQKLEEGKNYKVVCVGFYNLENLFDTIADPDTTKILQEEFTPEGPKHFTSERYHKKLENLAKVIADLGTETTPDGPAILGVCEIENKTVLEDLVNMPAIKDRNYRIVHYHSPDLRGIDVALLYQEKYFTYESSRSIPVVNPEDPDWKTRDQLLVTGKIDGETFHFMVGHWPSRRGGEKKSRPKRMLAAQVGLNIIDSIRASDPNAKLIYMGDLNDDPKSASLIKTMKTEGNINKVEKGDLYNPMEKYYDQGIGTLAWRDTWNLFDQLICTDPLVELGSDFSNYKFYKAKVYNAPYLKQTSGSFSGYPLRTYVGTTWQGGYSDHFPVYLYLIKEQ